MWRSTSALLLFNTILVAVQYTYGRAANITWKIPAKRIERRRCQQREYNAEGASRENRTYSQHKNADEASVFIPFHPKFKDTMFEPIFKKL